MLVARMALKQFWKRRHRSMVLVRMIVLMNLYLVTTQTILVILVAFVEQVNQAQAVQACRRQNAQLASIHSQTEQNLIHTLMNNMSTPVDKLTQGYWIGVTLAPDHSITHLKASNIDGTPFNYSTFAPGEPNNCSSSCPYAENCVLTYPASNVTFNKQYENKWNDFPCFLTATGYEDHNSDVFYGLVHNHFVGYKNHLDIEQILVYICIFL
uniref:C-type lectin domain-containing protein n=1 Tax=Acrobeloides nanus TaxID=290746 RepID=A0A914CDY7_9BILA